MRTYTVSICFVIIKKDKFSQSSIKWQEMVARACLDKTCHPPSVALFSCQWLQLNMDNFKFPFAFASKRKKLDALDGLPQFSWHETASQEVIGQGSFGSFSSLRQ